MPSATGIPSTTARSSSTATATRVYRKAFLYGGYEKGLFAAPPPQSCIVELGGLKVGVLICYDVEFPENVRRLAQAGADLVAVPTALPASEHAAFIARNVIAVRAFENQVHVAYANHCGADENFAYAGLSHVAAPDGATLAAAGTEPCLLIADIDLEAYAAAREVNPYLDDLQAGGAQAVVIGEASPPAAAKAIRRTPPLRRRSWTSRR